MHSARFFPAPENRRMENWTKTYLMHVLDKLDISMNELSARADVAASTINRPLREKDWKYQLSPRSIAKIHKATGIDPAPFIPKGAREPAALYQATGTDTASPPPAEAAPAPRLNEIDVQYRNGQCSIRATVDRAGLAKLRAKLEAVAALMND